MVSDTLQTGTAEVNGTRLYFESRGRGPTLLFVHGFTLDHRMWQPQAAALAERFRVVCYDVRGFGHSAMPGAQPYRHWEDAAALCEQLDLGRVVVVGHSIAAAQTLELALSRPDLVAGWVPICMSGLGGIPFPPDVTAMFGQVRAAARAGNVAEAKRIWGHCGWFTTARQHSEVAHALDQMIGDYSAWHWQNDNPAQGITPPAGARLAELRMPALVITGALDLRYNAIVGEALLRSIPGAKALRIPEAGHMANLESPAAVNQAIAAFAQGLA